MNRLPLYIVIALLLIGGSIYGTRELMGPADTKPTASKIDEKAGDNIVVCIGFVDAEKGVARLYPRMPGLVVKVAEDNQQVKKGDVLLQIDDTLARLEVRAAESDLMQSQDQVALAVRQEKTFPFKKKQQELNIVGLKAKRDQIVRENKSKLDRYTSNGVVDPIVKSAMDDGVHQIDALIQVEESKQAELQMMDPELDTARAKSIVEAKKAIVEKAKKALDLYQVIAPSDGVILRAYAHAGEVLGSTPQTPALEFAPDGPLVVRAEVQQEWGSLIKLNQSAQIRDDIYQGTSWEGEVKSISRWYAQKRSHLIEPFNFNDVRTLDCVIELKNSKDLRIGQRVLATISIAK